ncbi:SDR family oxidoreductase [Rhodopila globiformis]|uniref:Short-chain dehydrogenase n=1 Tax=Rhodopila globiformis TaxID=1071 RepID=A0A2S6MVZ3_RHOGL|nr:SDR family oxidoreductase [Rhodopila globiformis]PPQ26519.1 short-chain dehydrogenase [Rhodopila globiformis]
MTDHRLALVVGANRGIGLGVVQVFLDHGWDVIATARQPGNATALRALADSHPGRVTIAALDVTDTAAVDGFGATLNGRVLDAALINAGVAGPGHRSASQATMEETGALMFINAVAPVRLARALAGHLRSGSGVLAFTSSVMGSVAMNGGGHELYRASKAALNSLTRGLAVELRGRKLTVLSLHPGWVATDMGGAGAPVSVKESAEGLVAVIEKQAGSHGHRFLDYTGKELAW